MWLLLLLLSKFWTFFLVAPSLGFAPSARSSFLHRPPRPKSRTSAESLEPLFASREEEIARLEEQLRKLREEEKVSSTLTDFPNLSEELSEEEKKIAQQLEMIKGKDMLLSERELIGDGIVENAESEVSGGGIFKVVGAVVALILLIAFSQVPVGQESLSQYSATGSSAVKTIDLGDMNPDAPSQ